jgi:Fur family transcriptional regulator, ferric uptake regulator
MGAHDTATAHTARTLQDATNVEPSQLRRAGLKITVPRLKILEILAASQPRHMSAEDVYRRLLESDQDIGLATEGGTAVFELDEGEHHDHIVCTDCGRVEEFSDDSIEERQRAIADRLGFEITDHSLTLHGRCVRVDCPYRLKQD